MNFEERQELKRRISEARRKQQNVGSGHNDHAADLRRRANERRRERDTGGSEHSSIQEQDEQAAES